MKHLKSINEYVSYQGIELKNVDIDYDLNLDAELKKIRILYTTFREFGNLELDDIEGQIDPFAVDLNLGPIQIYGEYEDGIEETIVKLNVVVSDLGVGIPIPEGRGGKQEDFTTEFRYHKHGSMGETDMEDFEKEVDEVFKKLIDFVSRKKDEKMYTLCVSHEGYVTNNILTGTKEEIEKSLEEYQIYIVKGTQIEGKRLGVTSYKDDSEYNSTQLKNN